MNPAEELRAGAAKIRETAGQVVFADGKNGFEDWAESYSGRDDHLGALIDGRDLAWIALVHPGLADPLAAWLEASADDMDEHGAVEGSVSKKVHPVSLTFGILLAPRPDWTAALKTARMINGGAQ